MHCLILCIQIGWTPLLIACSEGCADVVKELLHHQIQLEIENNVSQQKFTSCYVTQLYYFTPPKSNL
jgi:ankyrin repeat protein